MGLKFNKYASDATIVRRLKREGRGAPFIRSYLLGWHQVRNK